MGEKVAFDLIKLIKSVFELPSTREAKRLVNSGAVEINGYKITAKGIFLDSDSEGIYKMRLGKRRFEDIRLTKGMIEVLK